jgi:hypothetical protein
MGHSKRREYSPNEAANYCRFARAVTSLPHFWAEQYAHEMALTWVGPLTTKPKDLTEARKRVLRLYAEWLRAIPRAVEMYRLDTPASDGRRIVRSWFEKNKHINDLDTIHMLTVKSTMELIEVYNRWKQRPHMLTLFGPPHQYPNEKERIMELRPNTSPFLADFLSKQ